MSWKKHVSLVSTDKRLQAALLKHTESQSYLNSESSMTSGKYSSNLPEIYAGHPQRLERYVQYDNMDQDSEINAALDTIADFSTQPDEATKQTFDVIFNEEPNASEMEVVRGVLRQWIKFNDLDKKIWRIFRNTLKYGDQFFIRDPETLKLNWVDAYKVEKVIVDEGKGKIPEQYFIKDLDLNLVTAVATTPDKYGQNIMGDGTKSMLQQSFLGGNNVGYQYNVNGGSRSSGVDNAIPVDATHVVHFSLSEGLDANWPFGTSILEPVFKVFKQKELLEDSIIIYRVQRAPERRVFYVDVGNMPIHKSGAYLEKIKMELHQRRMPVRNGSNHNAMDARYDPQALLDDFFFAQTSEGRGSRVEVLPGGDNLGCFAMDTKIRLLDGRDVSIEDIAAELSKGRKLWTYSCDPITGRIQPGPISWAGVTRKKAKVMKITLSNGNTFICTPDHNFPIRKIGFKEIKDLTPGQELIGLKVFDKSNWWNRLKLKWRKFQTFIDQPRIGFKLQEMFKNELEDYSLTKYLTVKAESEKTKVYITKIEYLKKKIDVGTLTIDQNEEYHDYHTYALSAGVFAKNSIDDLKFFNNKLIRGLRVPSSYLPTGPDDGSAVYNDGRVGTAYIQEYRFARYCQRLQTLLSGTLDREFKLFMKQRGFKVDSSLYDLEFNPPQNFRKFAQIERDAAMVSVWQTLADVPYISKRFLLTRYLGWTEEEVFENEKLWKEENAEVTEPVTGSTTTEGGMGLDAVGVRDVSDSFDEPLNTDEEMSSDDMSDVEAPEGDFDMGDQEEIEV